MNAGSKAVNDASKIFKSLGYEGLLPKVDIKNKYLKFLYSYIISIQVMIRVLFLPKGSQVALNFPPIFYFERVSLYFLKKRSKHLHVFVLIHDIYELRLGSENPTAYRNLMNYKDSNFYFIAHNNKMISWLIKEGYEERHLINLEIFDYLTTISDNAGGKFNKGIVIAGNLTPEKSQYLEKLSRIPEINFNLYGPNLAKEVAEGENIHYFGSFPSDEVPNVIEGSYGLVWDSEKLEGGVGTYGNYQRYNNPHKTSLYLAAGFPVIVWKEAALAEFVLENNLGFAVNSLLDFPEKIAEISEEDYNKMITNVQKMGNKIRSGYFLSEALKKAENILEENK